MNNRRPIGFHAFASIAALFLVLGCTPSDEEPQTTAPGALDAQNAEEGASAGDEAVAEAADSPTVVRTNSANDVKLATDILTAFVTSDEVDARNFSVTVENGVANLTASEGTPAEAQERAAALAQTVEGVESVEIAGSPAPHVERAEAEEAEQLAAGDQEVEGEATAEDAAVEPGAGEADMEAELEEASAAAEPEEIDEAEEEPAEAVEEPAADEAEPEVTGDTREYTIRRGDTLSVIAARELGQGSRWMEIYEMNRSTIGSNPDGIRDGMVIRLPVE